MFTSGFHKDAYCSPEGLAITTVRIMPVNSTTDILPVGDAVFLFAFALSQCK